jgi:hypothetical protein
MMVLQYSTAWSSGLAFLLDTPVIRATHSLIKQYVSDYRILGGLVAYPSDIRHGVIDSLDVDLILQGNG